MASAIVDNDTLSLGQAVRAHRLRAGLSMEDLAQESGVSPRTIWTIEAGQPNPRWENLRKLATALGLTVAQLITPPAA
jgi:transcriptional regulator with XRE-family HTH domain